ncbi:hypothetical protein OCOJLMKI_5223 [Methylobacterium iners]|uniref:Uncharacterized protein n=1 Tax=Methylobacterium iners TaxID=418707 RepID=A0ABQ4S664_9HYPH|nr:hypothetical protein OCOJLMKI_5223 [Methylobacterium iners]
MLLRLSRSTSGAEKPLEAVDLGAERVCFATRGGSRILSVPYPQELNDIPAIVARKDSPAQFADAIVAAFDEMREQSASAPLVMGIALHPYIVGQPHRLRPLRKALAHIADHRDAIWPTGRHKPGSTLPMSRVDARCRRGSRCRRGYGNRGVIDRATSCLSAPG